MSMKYPIEAVDKVADPERRELSAMPGDRPDFVCQIRLDRLYG